MCRRAVAWFYDAQTTQVSLGVRTEQGDDRRVASLVNLGPQGRARTADAL